MTSRRTFIKTASLVTLAGMAFPDFLKAAKLKNIGLELYTVRNQMDKDMKGTLKKVAALGYKDLENGHSPNGFFYGMKAKDFNKFIGDLGMNLNGSHIGFGSGTDKGLKNQWDEAVHEAAEGGLKYLIVPYLDAKDRATIDDYKKLCELFNKCGEVAKKSGLQLCYHNHDFEFQKLDNELPYDVILANTDPNLVKMELDLYWITKAGYDPLTYFDKHPGRFPLWHVKDMDKTEKKHYTEVGNGKIDFARIFKQADKAGMKHFYVEQDECPGDPLVSIASSMNYLKNFSY